MLSTMKETFIDNNLTLMNTLPTRILEGKKSQIDHFWTNKPKKIKCVEQNYNTFSDHSLLIIHRHMKVNHSEEQYIIQRKYNQIDFEKMKRKINSILHGFII